MTIGCGLRRMAMLFIRGDKDGRRFKGEEGAALLEIAIALPLMLVVVTGAISFSLAFYNLQELQNAVSTAAQGLAGARSGSIADPCAQVVSQVEAALPGWTSSNLTFTVIINNYSTSSATYGPTAGSLSCAAAGPPPVGTAPEISGDSQTITVSYAYSWFTIFTWKPYKNSTPSSALSATETVLAD